MAYDEFNIINILYSINLNVNSRIQYEKKTLYTEKIRIKNETECIINRNSYFRYLYILLFLSKMYVPYNHFFFTLLKCLRLRNISFFFLT